MNVAPHWTQAVSVRFARSSSRFILRRAAL
jgi:hypothetical protein